MSEYPVEQFYENGIAVIENFFSENEVNELKETAVNLCKNAPEKNKCVFGTKEYECDPYYYNSGNKLAYFYDRSAVDADGNLLVEKEKSISRLAHGCHLENPVFGKYVFDNRVRNLTKEVGFKKPVVLQSLFIFKNPKVGTEVKQHQDATYFLTDPIGSSPVHSNVIGFWIPIEDATVNNSCLWFIKGSHKLGLLNRFVRTTDEKGRLICAYEKPAVTFPREQFTPCPVKAGSLVLIHGLVVHMSDANLSDQRRCAYTFHIMETQNSKYLEENWLQLPKGETFKPLF